MTRILRIIARLNVGGPAIHATLLTDRLDPSRYRTTLVTGTEAASEGNYLALHGRSSARLVQVPDLGRELSGARDVGSLRALVSLIRRERPHIVHTHAAKAGALGRVAAALCRVPVVVHTYHGHVLRGYFSPRKEQVFRGIERGLARVTDELVAVTPRVRQELLDMGIGRPESFSVVPLGFDLDQFEDASTHRGELRRELGLAPDVPLAGIVARLVPIKAHEVFVAAARLLHAERPDMHFVVVGDGERRQELERLVTEAGLQAVTHLLGWRADLARIYADLDVVTLTSRNEGSPVALIEAMACGRPVVSTRVGGVPDVVEHGVTGWLVDMDDAAALARTVLDVLAEPSRAALVARAGREHVKATYGAGRLVADIDALYTRLLARKGVA
ncbi:glycosyl transferase family 1 [Luteitalea sp. TBR-22]|uniref:glycosyltransferase n=1 Tax=Luteitalea sp. TBR-22 TaxID=2802971 RepID=UPI001AF6F0AD|nr:glycosyltransferase [Luteitalea sp. TBR-22]BCS34706.1 glycosyl transferase family 1 [Luteitalea sp. TBR-22]